MMTRILCLVLLASGVAACTTVEITTKPQPNPPVWSATYNTRSPRH